MTTSQTALLLERLGALLSLAVREDAARHGLLPIHIQVLHYLAGPIVIATCLLPLPSILELPVAQCLRRCLYWKERACWSGWVIRIMASVCISG